MENNQQGQMSASIHREEDINYEKKVVNKLIMKQD